MKEIDITPELDKRYLLAPNECPFCDSNNITADHFEASDIVAWRDVSCEDCGAEWTERFELNGIANAYIPEKDDD